MLSHQEMIGLQAEKHELIEAENYLTADQYVLHLMHSAAYSCAARLVGGKSVLDLGCNTGYGTNILADSAESVIGVDVAERAINHAREKYGSKGIQFEVVDGVRIPFGDETFDVVTGFQLIEHLVEYDSFMAEVKRVLAPDGIVVFTTPNALLRLDPGMKPWNQFHVREFNPEELETVLDGYFAEVEVLGLYASDEIYAIEVNRVDRARRMARADSSAGTIGSVRSKLRKRAKSILPESMLSKLRNMELRRKNTLSLREVMDNHGVQDFDYRAGNLNDALDFMAICSSADIARFVDVVVGKAK